MPNCGRIAGVAAQQRRVGAVQRGDNSRPQFRRQHFAGQNCRRGVRHRVVNVQHIEPVVTAHLLHFHRQRQRIVWILEKAIVVHLDAVKMQSRHIVRQPEGPFVAEEMDFMPAPHELFPQCRSQHAAAADSRITGNANVQRFFAGHVKTDCLGG